MTEDWATALRQGEPDRAWDLFLTRYRRLIFAAIRHYTSDQDDVMEVFAQACEHLRADDLRRLRVYLAQPSHQARFTTWLVTVVRHLAVDWFRRRDGRRRVPAVADHLPPLQQQVFELVFLQGRGHVEAYELLRSTSAPKLTFRQFLSELRATYRAAGTMRRGRAWQELAVPEPPAADAPPPAEADDVRRLAGQVLVSLSPEDRVAVELYVVEGLPAEQVATILGLPNAKGVYNRVYRALASARERLEQAGIRREDLW